MVHSHPGGDPLDRTCRRGGLPTKSSRSSSSRLRRGPPALAAVLTPARRVRDPRSTGVAAPSAPEPERLDRHALRPLTVGFSPLPQTTRGRQAAAARQRPRHDHGLYTGTISGYEGRRHTTIKEPRRRWPPGSRGSGRRRVDRRADRRLPARAEEARAAGGDEVPPAATVGHGLP